MPAAAQRLVLLALVGGAVARPANVRITTFESDLWNAKLIDKVASAVDTKALNGAAVGVMAPQETPGLSVDGSSYFPGDMDSSVFPPHPSRQSVAKWCPRGKPCFRLDPNGAPKYCVPYDPYVALSSRDVRNLETHSRCQCGLGFKNEGGVCARCPPGSITYMNEQGMKDESWCFQCPAGEAPTADFGACKKDCVLSAWGAWMPCSIDGSKLRFREVTVNPNYHGKKCGKTWERHSCRRTMAPTPQQALPTPIPTPKPTPPTVDSSNTVDKLIQHAATRATPSPTPRPRPPSPAPTPYPTLKPTPPPTPAPKAEIAVTMEPAVDCEVSGWGSWSTCPKCTHEGAIPQRRFRRRTITTWPRHGGKACPTTRGTGSCSRFPVCAIDCEMSTWFQWGPCSEKCGGGVQYRYRAVFTEPKHGGKVCGATRGSQKCNTKECTTELLFGSGGPTTHQELAAAAAAADSALRRFELHRGAKARSCTIHRGKLGDLVVQHNWSGMGYGAAYCRKCVCHDGELHCTKESCKDPETAKVCSHSKCTLRYLEKLNLPIMVVKHAQGEKHGPIHHCSMNGFSSCTCTCYADPNLAVPAAP